MAGKITDLTAIVTVDPAADLMEIVDVSDTSMSPTGTNKKVTPSQLVSGVTPTISTDERVLGLDTGAPASAAELTVSAVLDWLSATQGDLPYRDSAAWGALAPGVGGDLLQTGGAGGNPSWVNVVTALDKVTNVQGSLSFRGSAVWQALNPTTTGFILTTNGAAANPAWADPYSLIKTTRPLFDHYADAGNGTTVETDLYSDTLATGQLAANGGKVSAQYGGVFVSSATATRQVRIYFGGTLVFDTGTLTLSLSAAWDVYVDLIRVSASVVRACISFTTEGAALAAYTAYTEVTGLTLSGTNVLKITGQAAGVGAATNDIVAKMGSVTYTPAA